MMTAMRENMPLIMWILVGAFLATIVFSWGMGGFSNKDQLDGVVGKIGKREILYDQYNKVVQDRIARLRQQRDRAIDVGSLVAEVRTQRHDAVERLVARSVGRGRHLGSQRQNRMGLLVIVPALPTQAALEAT